MIALHSPPPVPTHGWSLDPGFSIQFNPSAHAPCWFYRFMQRWLLGIRWRKL